MAALLQGEVALSAADTAAVLHVLAAADVHDDTALMAFVGGNEHTAALASTPSARRKVEDWYWSRRRTKTLQKAAAAVERRAQAVAAKGAEQLAQAKELQIRGAVEERERKLWQRLHEDRGSSRLPLATRIAAETTHAQSAARLARLMAERAEADAAAAAELSVPAAASPWRSRRRPAQQRPAACCGATPTAPAQWDSSYAAYRLTSMDVGSHHDPVPTGPPEALLPLNAGRLDVVREPLDVRAAARLAAVSDEAAGASDEAPPPTVPPPPPDSRGSRDTDSDAGPRVRVRGAEERLWASDSGSAPSPQRTSGGNTRNSRRRADPPQSPADRLAVGMRVRVSEMASPSKVWYGCLKPSQADCGRIEAVADGPTPFRVRGPAGDTFWYSAADLVAQTLLPPQPVNKRNLRPADSGSEPDVRQELERFRTDLLAQLRQEAAGAAALPELPPAALPELPPAALPAVLGSPPVPPSDGPLAPLQPAQPVSSLANASVVSLDSTTFVSRAERMPSASPTVQQITLGATSTGSGTSSSTTSSSSTSSTSTSTSTSC
eukprot:TRINITY_DN3254_c0_g4_i1.p1 TRINITY_DN3254_c0_g4~~TRINITY_DN3254_c0_g4_i1.p1  ORF type:complete len:598 (+),score=267.11 TRINITY_DN3254_c0_g4_i1:145-1794(+)